MQPCSWLAAGRLLLLPSGEFEDEALVLRTSYDATAEQQALDSSVDQRTDALITTYAFHEIPEHRLEALEEGSAYAPVRDHIFFSMQLPIFSTLTLTSLCEERRGRMLLGMRKATRATMRPSRFSRTKFPRRAWSDQPCLPTRRLRLATR